MEIQGDDFASEHLEKDLETWITNNPSLLGGKLLPIKRQLDVPGVGVLDLLCIDDSGKLVVVEFKRDLTSREAVAQSLDYASWLDATTDAEIRSIAQESLERPIEDTFLDYFGSDLQSLTPQNHRIVVVAPRLDSSAERIINYLADRGWAAQRRQDLLKLLSGLNPQIAHLDQAVERAAEANPRARGRREERLR